MSGTRAYLWAHEDEAKGVHSSHQGVEDPGVPGLVRLVLQGIYRVAYYYRVKSVAQVHHGLLVILLGLGVPVKQHYSVAHEDCSTDFGQTLCSYKKFMCKVYWFPEGAIMGLIGPFDQNI